MMIPQSQLFIVEQLTRITAKEVRYLEQVVNKLRLMNIDLAWVESLENSEDHSVTLDAFVARFGRLQDTLGDKLLPALLRLNLEKVGSQLDNLFRGEKFGWIESTQTWIELRELRNRLVHEYMESTTDLLSALQLALQSTPILYKTQVVMAEVVRKVEGK